MTETVTGERTEVTSLVEFPHSIMPEGVLETLDEAQTRDLVTSLMSKSQVPLPE